MKIYTKTGDQGTTSLIGGVKVSKNNERIHAYGTVDELNSYLGIVRDAAMNSNINEALNIIQNLLFNIGSHLAAHPVKNKMKLPEINEAHVQFLEQQIDAMNEQLPVLTNFILPGGHLAASYCHVARCVCRRAERLVVALDEHEHIEPIIVKYLNRLSDYLFVLARKISFDAGAPEIKWMP